MMKTPLILSAAAAMLLCSMPADAQTVVRETTTTAAQPVEPVEIAGTVTEFSPDTVMVRTQESAAPVRYAFSKETEYVDDTGNRVTREVVKSGAPVTLRYIKDGDRMIVNRVIVHKTVPVAPEAVTTQKTTTTTTTTEGRHERDRDKDHDRDRDKDRLRDRDKN